MSERVEHRATITTYPSEVSGEEFIEGEAIAECVCGWSYVIPRAVPSEAVTAYQEHVYAEMGREAAEWLKVLDGDLRTYGTSSETGAAKFLARLRAALEVEESNE